MHTEHQIDAALRAYGGLDPDDSINRASMRRALMAARIEPAEGRPTGYVLEIDGRINWDKAASTRAGAEGIESLILYGTAPRDRKPIRILPVYTSASMDVAMRKALEEAVQSLARSSDMGDHNLSLRIQKLLPDPLTGQPDPK